MSVAIKIENAVKRFGDKTIIPDLSLFVNEGEFFTLLGPSGCGKTTLLRMIAGFNTIEGGKFYFDNKLINNLPPHKRNIGMIFQNYAVFPHLTVKNNVGFGLAERKIKDPIYTEKVKEILESVQISDLIDRIPSQMSGGQQQRIALARAIVIQPDVLLMDEPLSNLDAKLRKDMRSVIKRIQNENKITTIYVTHDQEEALSMSDRIAIMNKGVIQQIGNPREIYSNPANLFVAKFIGSSNEIEGKILKENNEIVLDLLKNKYVVDKKLIDVKDVENVKVVIRPHELYFSDSGIKGKVKETMYLGSIVLYYIELYNEDIIEVHLDVNEIQYNEGDDVFLDFNPAILKVFDAKSGYSIRRVNQDG